MTLTRQHLIALLVGLFCGLVAGFFIGKGIYDRPIEESVTRDTVRITDTIPHYYPQPVDGTVVRTEYRWLTRVDHIRDTTKMVDTVLVEMPIESKHYHADEYDAWVSGFEPSLDSIKVYNETQFITETITRMKPPNKWSLYVNAGVDYGTTSQFWQPYASGELTINNDKRLQLGIEGGVKRSEVTNNFEPFAGAKLKMKIF